MWNDWCTKYKVKMDLNHIQFGIRITQLNNKIKSKTGEEFYIKESRRCHIIQSRIFNKFIDILEQ